MTSEAHQIDRESPRLRGDGKPIGWQHWRELLFVHWQVDADALAQLLLSYGLVTRPILLSRL